MAEPTRGTLGIGNDLRVYRLLARARVRSELQYRTTFAAFTLAQAVITFLDCVVILIFFTNVPLLGGWDRSQVVYMYAVATMGLGVADLAIGSIEHLPEHIRTGTLDRFLVRPAGVLPQLLGHEFALRRLGRVGQAVVVLAIAVATADVAWTPARVGVAVAGVFGAALLFFGLFVLTSSIAFWSPNTQEFANAFTYGGATVGQYPTHVFPSWLRVFFLGVVPAGAVVYLPAMYALGAANPLGIPTWVQVASPLVCVPVLFAAAAVWTVGVRRYESTGS